MPIEPLIGEAKREGLDAIPSGKFKNNYGFFQIVMLADNIWRYFKMMAEPSAKKGSPDKEDPAHNALGGLADNTIRIARLKLLLIAAKLVFHDNRKRIKFSIYDTRTPAMLSLLKFLDTARSKVRPWLDGSLWPCRFSLNHS